MNWASLLLAVVFGTPAAAMYLRHKGPRATAILGGLAAVCLIAGVPSLLALLGHPVGAGPILLGIVGLGILSAMFVWWDIFRGEHKTPLMRRKAVTAGPGAATSGKANHHARPLLASVTLAVCAIAIALNWTTVWTGTSHGVSQTVSTISHQQA